ncbi:MAG: hypothetical protein AMJ93_10940 [Anaerolineae bacterium SM23_84]|nr:MAG: hypothetical protein AMJ93_10940 [Anaerolineae bacterium SM23_84]
MHTALCARRVRSVRPPAVVTSRSPARAAASPLRPLFPSPHRGHASAPQGLPALEALRAAPSPAGASAQGLDVHRAPARLRVRSRPSSQRAALPQAASRSRL